MIVRSLDMKFDNNLVQLAYGFQEKYVLDSDVTQIWATLAERSKVNLDILNLFIAIVSLG